MKKLIVLPVLFVFGFALFSGCAAKKGEIIKGEYDQLNAKLAL